MICYLIEMHCIECRFHGILKLAGGLAYQCMNIAQLNFANDGNLQSSKAAKPPDNPKTRVPALNHAAMMYPDLLYLERTLEAILTTTSSSLVITLLPQHLRLG